MSGTDQDISHLRHVQRSIQRLVPCNASLSQKSKTQGGRSHSLNTLSQDAKSCPALSAAWCPAASLSGNCHGSRSCNAHSGPYSPPSRQARRGFPPVSTLADRFERVVGSRLGRDVRHLGSFCCRRRSVAHPWRLGCCSRQGS